MMSDHVDVLVVGGGHNGLVAATLLARGGLSVTLLEKEQRVGGTLAIPVNRYNSVKLYGSTGAMARLGGNFTTVGIAWQFRWGGGL